MPHRPAVGCGVAGPAQIVGKPPLPRRQERQEGQRQRDQQTKTADNQEDCAVDGDRRRPMRRRTTELGLDQRCDRPEQPAREHQPDREGGRAQEHALGDQHSREVTPLGAERGADRDFFRRIVRSTISTARFAHTTTSTRPAATVTPSRIGCNCPTYRRWTDSSLTPLRVSARWLALPA